MGSFKETRSPDGIDVNAIIVGFSGPTSSGKTTFSSEISRILECKKISFGDYVRKVATERSIEHARENLQNLGAHLIQELGYETFCRNVLNMANWSQRDCLIIDGIRHVEVLNTLKTLTKPSKFLLVYIDIDLEKREERLKNQGLVKEDVKKIDSHSTEIQVQSDLKKYSDIIVDGTLSVEEGIKKILDYIK